MKNIQKRRYVKPVFKSIKLDFTATIQMMSEGTIPDPPWVTKNSTTSNDPFKEHTA